MDGVSLEGRGYYDILIAEHTSVSTAEILKST